jgi:alkylglycerol monooxygenase
MGKVIVYATPVFILLIAIELAWGWHKARQGTGRNTYRLADALNSMTLGMMSQFTAVFTRLLRLGIYTFIYSSISLVPAEAAREFWTTWYGWVLALVFYDFCYYWLHRAGHETAIFWAAHVVHHQSQDYNLSTALRQTSSGALLGWVFYIPMALAGVPPLVFGIVALIDLLYQFWVHTEHVGKLGWFDRWFCSPSNHRVHHAVNDMYLDKNYGGIWVVWDRMFGSFKDEDLAQPCIYGTRSPLNSWDPLWANAEGYASMLKDAWHAQSWMDKLRVLYKPPGWRPADVAARFPKPAFQINAVQKFEVPASRPAQILAVALFAALLQSVGLFLWFANRMPPTALAWGVVLLTAAVWLLGALLQRRVSVVVAVGIFALLCAVTAWSPLPQWISLAQYNQEFFGLGQ